MSDEGAGARAAAEEERPREEHTPDPRRWKILGVTLVVGFMSLLDVTIVNVAVPSMQEGLDTSAGTIQWVVSGYALAFGLTLVAGGRLGDAYGRRRLMLIGLTGFILSSAAVGFAPNIETVVAARLAQGATAGLLTPQNSGLIQQLFRGPERGRAFGAFGFTVSLSSALGPVLGGAIIALAGEEEGWRWLFLVNVPIGLAALVAIAVIVPGPDRRDEDTGTCIDVPGALLLGGAVLCVLFPLVSLESGALLPLVLLAGAPVLGWAFVRWEARLRRQGRPPLLDVSLLRSLPGYSTGMAIGALYFTGFTGVFLVLSVHLQGALDLTPLQAGLLVTPFAVGAAITAPISGRLVSRYGRSLTVVALVVMMTGTALTAWLAPTYGDGDIWMALVPCLFLAGVGGGGVISPNFTLTLAEVPPRMGGAAGAALQTGQRIGSSLGAALLMTTYGVAMGPFSAQGALRAALVASLVVLCAALAAAVWSQRHE
ncbi:MFS transporter [Nocardioides abyssi]|uniref:MFS transporter n=1 Tax=Nocardioides abyssi TaxID=3058370 RepID=A0ABT8ERI1_9ACTN|nr:MFS transporter [Nocardioides abyssi]MDN4160762.1 MFS transporter [Nocardioides abyssi]